LFDCAKDLLIEATDPRGCDGSVRQELAAGHGETDMTAIKTLYWESTESPFTPHVI
jgi:hypothetical protein